MYFIDGFVALVDRLGMIPDDVLVFAFLILAFYVEFLSFLFAIIYRLALCLFCWLRSRRKKDEM